IYGPEVSIVSAVAARPRPVSITIVTPRSRGRPLRGTQAWSITPDQASSPIAIDTLNEVSKRPLHHAEIGPPGDHGDIAVPLDVELQQTAFEQSDFIALAGNDTWAHFNTRRLVTVIVTMKLQASLATDQRPLFTLRWPLVEKMQRGAKIIQASRATRNEKRLRLHVTAKIAQLDAFKFKPDRRQIRVA